MNKSDDTVRRLRRRLSHSAFALPSARKNIRERRKIGNYAIDCAIELLEDGLIITFRADDFHSLQSITCLMPFRLIGFVTISGKRRKTSGKIPDKLF